MLSDSNNFQDEDGEVRLARKFIGKFRPDEPRNDDHAAGFDAALRMALDEADRAHDANKAQLPDAPKLFQAQITFEATIEVRSPGNVHEYRAIVVEQ